MNGPERLEIRSMLSVTGPIPLPTQSTEVLAMFADGTSADIISADLAPIGGRILHTYPDGPSLIALGGGVGVSKAIATLEGDSSVVYAQANSTIHIEAAAPDDTYYSQQWAFNNQNGVNVDALPAWDVTTGTPSTVVAVIDSGIDTSSPEFTGRLWTNPGDPAGSPYVGDVHGWNFINNNSNITDQDGHGTHVSGIIAANANNAYGVAGLAPNVELMVLKFIDANGDGSTSDAVAAIYYAVDHGAKVINASWGGDNEDPSLDSAIAYAQAHNVVFVTAAGNTGTNNDTNPVGNYPALDRTSNQISVAAVDENGNLASFSNYGATTVDLAAPGVDITSTVPKTVSKSGIATYSGTSMSTAYVTATVALVASLHPDWSATQLVSQVVDNVKPLPSLAGKTVSGGMVDAYAALTGSSGSATTLGTPSPTPTAAPSIPIEVQVRATIDSSDEFYAAQGGTNAGYVEALYTHLLGRTADSGGLNYFLNELAAGAGRYQVALQIGGSIEAEEYKVANWFITDLGRTDSVATLEATSTVSQWAALLASGVATDDAIHSLILGSDEYNLRHAGNLAWDISSLYQDILDRVPDPGGASHWYGQLAGGVPLQQVALGMLSSYEAKQVEVADWYNSDLDRSESVAQLESDGGVNHWASLLAEG